MQTDMVPSWAMTVATAVAAIIVPKINDKSTGGDGDTSL